MSDYTCHDCGNTVRTLDPCRHCHGTDITERDR